jgi:hypothetical protein
VVHVGDPDQTLASVSILSLAGGAVLSRLLASSTAAKVYVAAGILAVAHASTFYHSPYHLAEAASYNAVRRVDRMTTEAIGALNALRAQGPLTIVHYGSPVASRQITYYFPDDYVDILPGQPGLHATGEPVYTFFRHRGISPGDVPEEGLIRAGSQRIACLVPPYAHTSLPGWRKAGPVYVLDVIPQKGVEIGDYRLIWENR